MKKNLIILLAYIGMISFFPSCEKDGTNVVMLETPVPPTLVTLPDLTLTRDNGTDTLEFIGTPVDAGFVASATYFLEVCAAGNNFADALVIYSGVQDLSIKMTVSDLNGKLLKKFPADQVSSVEFRIRAGLVVDAGTGAPGTSTDPFVYSSDPVNSDITIYGLPRLDLIGSGHTQKIESPLGDGNYSGIVKISTANPFTLYDPDADVTYGGSGGTLTVDGPEISGGAVNEDWYMVKADLNELKYSIDQYSIGLVGDATPTGWGSDTNMEYDAATGKWSITIDLIGGKKIKFRFNDGWSWNLGGSTDNLVHNGADISIETSGNYTIVLTVTNYTQGSETGTFTIVKNN